MLFKFRKKSGEYVRLTDDEILHEASKVAARKFRRKAVLTSPERAQIYLKNLYQQHSHEIFGLILLDNQHRVLNKVELFNGTIDGAAVYPREVVKIVLKHNAAAVLLFHNHPSGIPEPSAADRAITGRLKEALNTIDVRILDHIIVGFEGIVSFSERGLL